MSNHDMEIESLSDEDLESVSGGDTTNSGSGTCESRPDCSNTGSGTCSGGIAAL